MERKGRNDRKEVTRRGFFAGFALFAFIVMAGPLLIQS
jgi:hypothetical protein